MAKGWENSKDWADGHWPAIEAVIRSVAGMIIDVQVADDDKDQKQATDYIVAVSSGDIACRIRAWRFWQKFGDVTLRNSRPSGRMTEVEKIRGGYCRWYLYGWGVADKGSQLGAWVFLDLDIFRESGLLDLERRAIPNHDGSSSFVSFSLDELRNHGCIVQAGGAAADWHGASGGAGGPVRGCE